MNRLYSFFKIVTIAAISMSFGLQTTAEDTEIYQAEASKDAAGRPKVLIIFDDSGSMRTDVPTQPPPYNPDTTYAGDRDTNRIYFETNNSDAYFPASVNRCAESYTALDTAGFFQGRIQRSDTRIRRESCGRRCQRDVTSYEWAKLRDNSDTRGADHVECQADIINTNNSNGASQLNGYPCEGSGGNVNNWYCDSIENINWGNNARTLYTGNYVNWYRNAGGANRTRIEIARDTVTAIIDANPSIDFGLALFNDNDKGEDGGRIVNRIIENSTTVQRTTLKNNVAAIQEDGWTPLCETTYEAYRYLAGLGVVYGDKLDSTIDTPGRDKNAESPPGGLVYDSPVSDCAYTYIILMTDGYPAYDTDANAAIETLTGKTCQSYNDDDGKPNISKNCLPEIVEYMANTDLDNDTTNGNQFAITYTIGFATDQDLLEDTAIKGKGQYYTADNATELADAFQSAITEILGTNESFTSPAVAVDTFSRTESRNEVFFAMFKPSDRINWHGNIKRLNLVIENDVAAFKDANGELAFDNSTGRISVTAQTVWSTTEDGDTVDAGGVGALLAAKDPASRILYSNTGSSGAFETYNDTNIDRTAYGLSTDDELFDLYDVADQTELTRIINWSRGIDVYDEDNDSSSTDNLEWMLADMLHSRPIVVNYGARSGFSETSPDQRLLVGTNGGFFHMFGVDDGQEDWAFFPKELAPILIQRQINMASTQHVYGIDAPAVTYIEDGGDGTISGNDTAYIYFGLRRGGRGIYALNISNPDSPEFLWKITGGSGDFVELGQTWSVPIVTVIPGYSHDHDNNVDTPNIPKKVLIFGAGYDINKDATGVGTPDFMGRGIFIVDATTGGLIRSITPGANSSSNIQDAGLIHSVPSTISVTDSNGDELTDRLYFGDTGGNLWRVDMPGNTLHGATDPEGNTATWYVTQVAGINAGATATATDRRIFNSPDVVRTKQKVCREYFTAPKNDVCKILVTVNYDAVLVGTGDRTNPNATDVDNQFYMFRDERLHPYDEARPSSSECSTAISAVPPVEVDFRCYLPLDTNDLADASSGSVSTSALESANGWKFDMSVSGEKVLARSLTIGGSVFFTTYSPVEGSSSDNSSVDSCVPIAGNGRLYKVDLQNASAKTDFNNDGTLDLYTDLGSLIPDTPSPHFGSDKKIRLLFPSGGGLLSGNPLDTGATMPQPYGIYWYREEQ